MEKRTTSLSATSSSTTLKVTGYKTRYSEHMVGWGRWIGSTILMRPEISYLRAYDRPAFDSGTKQNQMMIAGDLIWFY